MKLRLFTIACSIITCSLSLNEQQLSPRIVHPEKGPPICIIGDEDCVWPLQDVQWYMTYVLNVERFRVSTGYYDKLPIATDMLFMEIDEDLTRKSQEYAEACLVETQMESCHPPPESQEGDVSIFVTEYEMNTEEHASSRAAKVLLSLTSQIESISQEILEELVKNYRRVQETGTNLNDLAKLIHADVWKVGCGLADFLIAENKFKEVIVCSYGAPKLQTGKKLYIAGCVPCSNCPHEALCETGTLQGLCKVNRGKLPVYNEDKEMEEKICFKPEAPKPNPSIEREPPNTEETAVWKTNQQFNTQKCSGTNLCHEEWWSSNNGELYIDLHKKCIAITAFQDPIHIKEHSCFIFYYKKGIDETSSNVASVIAFAFEINSQNNYRVKEEKYVESKAQFKPIYLDLPWKNIHIHVGFGTRSDKDGDEDWYEIQVKDFKIEKGPCSSQHKENL